MSSNYGFDLQLRIERQQRERKQRTLEGQRERRQTPPGLAPVSLDAAVAEAEHVARQTLRRARTDAAKAMAWGVLPVPMVLALASLQPRGVYSWAVGLVVMLGVILIPLAPVMAVRSAWRSVRATRQLMRWSDVPVPVGRVVVAYASAACAAVVLLTLIAMMGWAVFA